MPMRYFNGETYLLLMAFFGFVFFPNFVLASKIDKVINQRISTMSIEEKAGQLVIFGLPHTEVTADYRDFVLKYKPGSFLLFKRNILSLDQVKSLNKDLYHLSYKANKLPPLIAVDQEGGSVSRIPIFPKHPNATSIGQTQDPQISNQVGLHIGKFLRELGFNMNLAPVLDLSSPLEQSFIGERSLGADPNVVKELSREYSKGLLKSNVIPTAKHFPGSGNIKTDPHDSVAKNFSSKEALLTRDLVPYQDFKILGRTSAVMMSHFIYPELDSLPATFSNKIINGLLREEIGYKGLIISDDLQMKGAKSVLLPEEGALKALIAGADIVMLSWSQTNQKNAVERIRKAIKDQELSNGEVEAKLRRILYVKAFANIYKKPGDNDFTLNGTNLTSLEYQALEERIVDSHIRKSLVPSILPQKIDYRSPAAIGAPPKICLHSFSTDLSLQIITHAESNKIKQYNLDKIQERSSCDQQVAIIKTPNQKNNLNHLPEKIKSKLLVINMGSAAAIDSKKYKRVIQLSFHFDSAAKKIAQHLKEMLRESNDIAQE